MTKPSSAVRTAVRCLMLGPGEISDDHYALDAGARYAPRLQVGVAAARSRGRADPWRRDGAGGAGLRRAGGAAAGGALWQHAAAAGLCAVRQLAPTGGRARHGDGGDRGRRGGAAGAGRSWADGAAGGGTRRDGERALPAGGRAASRLRRRLSLQAGDRGVHAWVGAGDHRRATAQGARAEVRGRDDARSVPEHCAAVGRHQPGDPGNRGRELRGHSAVPALRAARAGGGAGAGGLGAGRRLARARQAGRGGRRADPGRPARRLAAGADAGRLRGSAAGGTCRGAAVVLRHHDHGARLRGAQPLSHRRQPGAFGDRHGQPRLGAEPGPADQRQRHAHGRGRSGGRPDAGDVRDRGRGRGWRGCCSGCRRTHSAAC